MDIKPNDAHGRAPKQFLVLPCQKSVPGDPVNACFCISVQRIAEYRGLVFNVNEAIVSFIRDFSKFSSNWMNLTKLNSQKIDLTKVLTQVTCMAVSHSNHHKCFLCLYETN